MGRVVHFEIHAGDVERAAGFYRTVFGWTITRWGEQPYWLVKTGEASDKGIDGGLLPRRGPRPDEGAPVNAFACTVEVDDLDACLARATANGGTIALPRMPIPGVGWLAYCKDTEGNIVGIMQPDANAPPPG